MAFIDVLIDLFLTKYNQSYCDYGDIMLYKKGVTNILWLNLNLTTENSEPFSFKPDVSKETFGIKFT